MTIDFAALSAPFAPELVSWRVGNTNAKKNGGVATKGMALAYIDARDVMARLDSVCGPAHWQARYPHANGKTICEIGLKVGDEWVWKANGAGDTDVEAEKGAISDAFKRAAVLWGIGRYLYDIPSPWVAVNQFKQIEEAEHARLRDLLTKSAPQARPAQTNLRPTPFATAPDSPDLSAMTIAAKQSSTLEDLENWVADSAEKIAALSEYERETLFSRIQWLRSNRFQVAA